MNVHGQQIGFFEDFYFKHKKTLIETGSKPYDCLYTAEYYVRHYEETEDITYLLKGKAIIEALLDAYRAKKVRKEDFPPIPQENWFPLLLTYDVINQQGWFNKRDQKVMLEIAGKMAKTFKFQERGANHRITPKAAGWAMLAKVFPKLPQAKKLKAAAELCYQDWVYVADTWEYDPNEIVLFLDGALDLTYALGKEKEVKEFMKAVFDRYLARIHTHGILGSESYKILIPKVEEMWRNPWMDESEGMDNLHQRWTNVWIRAALLYNDNNYLWAAEQIFAGGQPSQGTHPAKAKNALYDRFQSFEKKNMKPTPPDYGPQVAKFHPLNHKMPERMILTKDRVSAAPVVSYFLHDRAFEYMQPGMGGTGRLYEYLVDGNLLLGSSAEDISPGTFANVMIMRSPCEDFPLRQGRGIVTGCWYPASVNLNLLPLWTSSEKWSLKEIQSKEEETPPTKKFVSTQKEQGVIDINREGYMGKNDSLTLTQITLELDASPKGIPFLDKDTEVLLSQVVLAGPAGEDTLLAWNSVPVAMKASLTRLKYDGSPLSTQELTKREKDSLFHIQPHGKGGNALMVRIPKQSSIQLTFDISERNFDVRKTYTRLGFEINYATDTRGWLTAPLRFSMPNLLPKSVALDQVQGGVLEETEVSKKGADVMGSFLYDSYFTYDSRWRRNSLLTSEGILIVVDELMPGKQATGMVAGPSWRLAENPSQGVIGEETPSARWFDTSAAETAWYVSSPKRLLLYFPHEQGRTYGTQLQSGSKSFATYTNTILLPGRTEYFVSVFVPHEASITPDSIVQKISTAGTSRELSIQFEGELKATFSKTRHTWAVKREEE